jgi:hypothetical protein
LTVLMSKEAGLGWRDGFEILDRPLLYSEVLRKPLLLSNRCLFEAPHAASMDF